jgi:hypothetical protein
MLPASSSSIRGSNHTVFAESRGQLTNSPNSLDRLSDRVSLPCAAGLGPGFCGRTGRPRRRSNLASSASEPTGRPVPSRSPQRREGFRLGAGHDEAGEAADAVEQGGDTHRSRSRGTD